MANFCSCDFAVWDALVLLKRSIDFSLILRIELTTDLLWKLGVSSNSVPAGLTKLSWNFHRSLCGCSALVENRQYITGLSIYYRYIPCFDGLYLKNRVLLAALWGKISIFHMGQTEHRSAQVMVHFARRFAHLLQVISFIECSAA